MCVPMKVHVRTIICVISVVCSRVFPTETSSHQCMVSSAECTYTSQYRLIERRCFYMSTIEDRRSWLQARQFCHQLGGDLATIVSSSAHYTIQQWLETSPGHDQYVWVGLTKTIWFWTTGGYMFVPCSCNEKPFGQ